MVVKLSVKIFVGKKLHMMGNYHIWQEGGERGSTEVMKKKGEWMSVFPIPPPP